MIVEVCSKCGRQRPDYIADPSCRLSGYCHWAVVTEAHSQRVFVTPGAFDELTLRVGELERVHTERLDMHVERLERLERPVDSRDAIAWELGHAAALRGDAFESNPFRKVGT